jgi:hypothetical protein
MHYQWGYLYTTDSDDYTVTVHYELPPTPTIAQLSLSEYYEFDDEAHAHLGITHSEFLDSNGVTRTIDYPNIPAYPESISVNGMTRVDWEMTVSNCWANYVFNAFFWNSVF